MAESRRVNIYINQEQATKSLEKLRERSGKLESELKKLPRGTDEFVKKSRELNKVNKRFDQVSKQLKGELGPSLNDLRSNAARLRNEIKQLPTDTEEYARKSKELREVNDRIKQHTTKVRGAGRAWDQMRKAIIPIGGAIAGALGAQQLVQHIGSLVRASSTLSDTFADVQKTTGLTKEEVRDLDRALLEFDTRTSRQKLLMLARDAGKLGITGKEDILGFVEAADQIDVALGEDLGEGAIRQLGKINDAFNVTQALGYKNAMLQTGSAINELGQASTAQEKFLVNFTGRLQGVANSADISVQNVLGLAATVDTLGLRAESSSTAIQKTIVAMFKDVETFAGIAGREVGAFSKLLEEDANEAFLQLLEGVQGNEEGLGKLVAKLEEMGITSERATQTIAALSGKTDELREQQGIANDAFEEGTSLTDEFEQKNNNLAATLDKTRKALKQTFVTSGVMDALKSIADRTLGLIRTLRDSGDQIRMVGKAILTVVTAWASYKAATIANTARKRAFNAATRMTSRTLRGTFLRSLVMARGGVRALSTAIRANPVGLIASAISTAVTAYLSFRDNVKEATEQQKEFNEAAKKGQDILDRTKSIEEQAGALGAMNEQRLEQFKSRVEREVQVLREEEEKIAQKANKEAEAVRKRREQLEARLEEISNRMANAQTESARDQLALQKQVTQEKLDQLKTQQSVQGINRMTMDSERQKLEGILEQINKRLEIVKKQEEDDKDGGDGGGGGDEGDPVQESIDQLEKLKAAIDKFNADMERRQMDQKQQQIQSVKDRAQEIIDQAKAAFEAEQITGTQLSEIIRDAQETEMEEVRRIQNEFANEFRENRQELIDEIASIEISDEIEKDERQKLKEHHQELLRMSKDYATEEARIREKLKNFKQDMNEEEQQNEVDHMRAMAQISEAFAQIASDLITITGQKQAEQTGFQKALALTQIAIETGKALAKGIAQSQDVGFPANLAAIATTVASVTSAIAQATRVVKGANAPSAPSSENIDAGADRFAGGGFTGTGAVNEPAGVVHKGEYVIPNHVLRKPKTLDLVEILEAERQGKQGFRGGGHTSPKPAAPSPQSSPSVGGQDQKDVVAEQRRMNEKMDVMIDIFANGIPAKVGFDMNEFEKEVIKMRKVRAKTRKKEVDENKYKKFNENRRINEL